MGDMDPDSGRPAAPPCCECPGGKGAPAGAARRVPAGPPPGTGKRWRHPSMGRAVTPRPPDIARGLSQGSVPGAAGAVAVAALVRTVVARTVVARTVVSYGWAGVICAMMSAALVTRAACCSRMSAWQPSDVADVTGPGTAIRGRPRSLARRAVAMVPLRAAA